MNSIGQKMAFNSKLKGNTLTIEPLELLTAGIYFIKVADNNNKEQLFKVLVNY